MELGLKVQGVPATDTWGAPHPREGPTASCLCETGAKFVPRPAILGSLHHYVGPDTQAYGKVLPLSTHCCPPFRLLGRGFSGQGREPTGRCPLLHPMTVIAHSALRPAPGPWKKAPFLPSGSPQFKEGERMQ